MTQSPKTSRKQAIIELRVFPIVLKTIINDAMNDKTILDDNDKKIRAKIRANANAIEITQHIKNTSHVARNQNEYDALRCAFDRVYSQRLIDATNDALNVKRDAMRMKRDAKRIASTNDAPTNDAPIEMNNA